MTETVTLRSIVVERTLPYPPSKVWKVLTQAELIAQWLMPNDFRPEEGARFTFQTRPMGDWDGIVHCEVLQSRPCELLRYSWKGGTAPNTLDTVVTWTIRPVGAGAHVRMEHSGFRPENEMAFTAMSPGWGRVLERIQDVLGAEARGENLGPGQTCEA